MIQQSLGIQLGLRQMDIPTVSQIRVGLFFLSSSYPLVLCVCYRQSPPSPKSHTHEGRGFQVLLAKRAELGYTASGPVHVIASGSSAARLREVEVPVIVVYSAVSPLILAVLDR